MGVYNNTPTVYLRHTEFDGEAVVSDEPGVVEFYEAKGWVRGYGVPEHLDPDAPDLPDAPDAPEEPEAEPEPAEPPQKKRARKSEPEAESATTTTEEEKVDG